MMLVAPLNSPTLPPFDSHSFHGYVPHLGVPETLPPRGLRVYLHC
jgi:hypothetical protein